MRSLAYSHIYMCLLLVLKVYVGMQVAGQANTQFSIVPDFAGSRRK